MKADLPGVLDALVGAGWLPLPNMAMSKSKERRYGAKGSLSIVMTGAKRGYWKDHEDGAGGGILELARHLLGGEEAGDAWGRRWADGTGGEDAPRPDSQPRHSDPTSAAREAAETAREATDKLATAQRLWDSSGPPHYTQTAAYLAARLTSEGAGRVLDSAALRHDPRLKHSDSRRYFGGMIAAVRLMPDSPLLAIHRTYLHPDIDNPEKAPLDRGNNKMLLGSPGCGGVWIGGLHPRVIVGEGIETTASAWLACDASTVGGVAALSTSGLIGLCLPDSVREVVIAVDVDRPNPNRGKRPGEVAARQAGERWVAEGRKVWLAFPGAHDGDKCDFNDLLQGKGVAAVRLALDAAVPFVSDAATRGADAVAELLAAPPHPLPGNVREPSLRSLNLTALPPREVEEARMRAALAEWADAAVQQMAWSGMDEQAKRSALRDMARARGDLIPGNRPDAAASLRKERAKFLAERGAAYIADWTAALEQAGWAKDAPAPAAVVIRATPGLGKTHVAMEFLAKAIKAAPVPVLVAWLVPGYGLAGEAKSRLADVGIETHVLRGRAPTSDDGEPMCGRKDLAEQVADLGLPVRPNLCERPGEKPCPYRFDCPYFAQADQLPVRGVVIATHNALVGGLPGGVKLGSDPAALVPVLVDESTRAALSSAPVDGALSGLRDLATKVAEKGPKEAAPILHALTNLLALPDCAGAAWQSKLSAEGITAEKVEAAAGALEEALGQYVGTPGDDSSIRWGLGQAHNRKPWRAAVAALSALALDMRMGRTELQSLRARTYARPDGEAVPGWRSMPPPKPVLSQPLSALFLDASADQGVYEASLGQPVRFGRFDVVPAMVLTQITSPGFSKTFLGISKSPTPEQEEAAEPNRARALAAVRAVVRRHGARKVLVIVPKALRALWMGDDKPKGISVWEAEGCMIGHFGALRGQDSARDCEAVVVIGRQLPTRQDVEGEASGLHAHDEGELVGMLATGEDNKFKEGWRALRTRGGGLVKIETWCHDDERVEILLRQVMSEEVTQAVHRVRPAQAPANAPKHVYLLAAVQHDMTVDHVTELNPWLQWMNTLTAVNVAPLVVDPPTLAERAPSAIMRRDAVLGRSAQNERVAGLSRYVIAEAKRIRRKGEGGRSAYKNGSYRETGPPTHVTLIIPEGEQTPRLVLSNTVLPVDLGEASAQLGRKVTFIADVGRALDEDQAKHRAQSSDAWAEAQAAIAARSQHFCDGNREGPEWGAFKLLLKEAERAFWSWVDSLDHDQSAELAGPTAAEEWTDERWHEAVVRAHALLDLLDPLVDDDGCGAGAATKFPHEVEAVERLLWALRQHHRPGPLAITKRPFARLVLTYFDASDARER